MAIHAYQKFYLNDAQQNLAVMFDYALRTLKYDGDQFFLYFIQSEVAQKFGHANPKYIVGMSGIELCQNVLTKIGATCDFPSEPKTKQGKEFWLGWVLAYYQWLSCRSFAHIQRKGLGINEVVAMYHPLHEADLSKFADVANDITRK